MSLSSCIGKRRGKGQHGAQGTQRSPIPWIPSPYGQSESGRFIAGDATASSDLSSLITRAGATSARVPHLNSTGVVATSELLRGRTEGSISHLAVEQAAAQRRSRAARPWSFGSLFFYNASLIGEDFQQSVMGIYDQDKRRSVRAQCSLPRRPFCLDHWKIVYCSEQCCSVEHPRQDTQQSRPLTAEDLERISKRPEPVPFQTAQRAVSITPSLEKELDAQGTEEEVEEFNFNAYLRDDSEYEQALCEITAITARTGSPKLISLGPKEEAVDKEAVDAEAVDASLELKRQSTEGLRWSTKAQTGCSKGLADASKEQRSSQSSRLSLIAPPSGPPSIPLPPSPPSTLAPSHRRFSTSSVREV